MQEISICLTASLNITLTRRFQNNTSQCRELFSDDRGRQHRLLNKTAAMQSKTDDRRTTGSRKRNGTFRFLIKPPLYVLTVNIHHILFVLFSRFKVSKHVFMVQATNSQSFSSSTNTWTNTFCLWRETLTGARLVLIVSYSGEKLFFPHTNQ